MSESEHLGLTRDLLYQSEPRHRGETIAECIIRQKGLPLYIAAYAMKQTEVSASMVMIIREAIAEHEPVEFDITSIGDDFNFSTRDKAFELDRMIDGLMAIASTGEARIHAPYPCTLFTFPAVDEERNLNDICVACFTSPKLDSIGIDQTCTKVIGMVSYRTGTTRILPIFVVDMFTGPDWELIEEGIEFESWKLVSDELAQTEAELATVEDFTTGCLLLITHVLTLMSCKNIDVADDEPPHRSRQEWRRLQRSGVRPVKRKKIVVHLPGKRIESITGRGTSGNRARHLVRGHFSHYTEEKPLFGKVSGTFWIPAHTRGKRGEAAEPEYVVVPD